MVLSKRIIILLMLLNFMRLSYQRVTIYHDVPKRPSCTSNSQCISYATCNTKVKRCYCRNGLVGDGYICNPGPGRTTCSSDDDCELYSKCLWGVCHCRDEFLGDGTTCKPAPQHKCQTESNCHPFAYCMDGHCVCKDSTGNGRYCRSDWSPCITFYPCGWNAICAVDKFMVTHAWCLCEIGTDKDGNCIECKIDKHCRVYAKCINNKCVCRDELRKSKSGYCTPNPTPHKCKENKDCHPQAICDGGSCICQGQRVGNGKFCRDAKPCAPGWMSCGRGVCLIDPLLPSRTDCKCNKGYFEYHPWGCVECRSNRNCPSYASCVDLFCKCKGELVKKGKTCIPAPLHKCHTSEDCHPKAKCFYRKCVCQGDTTGNGLHCRDSLRCSSVQLLSCGNHAACLVDPVFPKDPICRCHRGFKLSQDNKCVDIDECKTLRARCGSRCRNTEGSFHCVPCPPGQIEGSNGACIAPSKCDCGENEECYDGECVCEEGYEINTFGKCVWPDDGELSVVKANSIQVLSRTWMLALGLFGYQAITVSSLRLMTRCLF